VSFASIIIPCELERCEHLQRHRPMAGGVHRRKISLLCLIRRSFHLLVRADSLTIGRHALGNQHA
jgi:hypothetical protein